MLVSFEEDFVLDVSGDFDDRLSGDFGADGESADLDEVSVSRDGDPKSGNLDPTVVLEPIPLTPAGTPLDAVHSLKSPLPY